MILLPSYRNRVSSSPAPQPSYLELLEPRIAPAVFNVGFGVDSLEYDDAPFIATNSPDADPAVTAIFGLAADHYYMPLKAGDLVRIAAQNAGYENFIQVTGGKVLAFFYDANANGIVEQSELSGFSISSTVGLRVSGTVNGDIIGNLDTRTGLMSVNDLTVTANSIRLLDISGDVTGSVITAGNIANVSVKTANQISTASDGTYLYSFGGDDAGVGEATLNAYAPANNRPGGNIANVTVANLLTGVIAGDGGAGGAGGAISKVTVTSDPDGFVILAGNGGSGTRGGIGGNISNILINGVTEVIPTPGDLITIRAGDGAAPLLTGAGGAGGNVSSVNIGYILSGRTLIEAPVSDVVVVSAGNGGDGTTIGGRGGNLSTTNVLVNFTDGDPLLHEITLTSGNGGAGGTSDGVGGNILNIVAKNNYFSLLNIDNDDSILVAAGNAGNGGAGRGMGGSITGATLLANNLIVTAGDGADGIAGGGRGGSISRITFDFSPTDEVSQFSLIAGDGGDSVRGTGGMGGSVNLVTGLRMDLREVVGGNESFILGGDGGTVGTGRGALGGSVTNVKIFEPYETVDGAVLNVGAGDGGDGSTGGGNGGLVSGLTFFGYATLPQVSAGSGGNATVAGPGGIGGLVTRVAISAERANLGGPGNALIQAGNGGDGAGVSGRGGNGGALSSTNFFTNVSLTATAGDGGTGGGGPSAAVGMGGAISRVAITSNAGSAELIAGSAGTPGVSNRGALGGSITNAVVIANDDVSVMAGNGTLGGLGGSIVTLAWYGTTGGQPDSSAAPVGDILILAGQGSVSATAAGIGGSIRGVSGFASANPGNLTQIYAGDGNGGVAGARAALGGSITNVSLFGGESPVDIRAGNGGSLTGAGAAGKGGSVTGVGAVEGVDIQVIAAGNGGDSAFAKGRGGLGGTITRVNIFGNIGEINGEVFGIDTMGGIFSGAGGTGGEVKLNGKAGNVTHITAHAISSIVAGRPTSADPETLQLVTLVDRVYLRGLDAPTVQPDGSFDLASDPLANPPEVNFLTSNTVGGIAGDLALANANQFKFNGPTPPNAQTENPDTDPANPNAYEWTLGTTGGLDGLVAAISMTSNKNFTPQAFLTQVNANPPIRPTDPWVVSPTGYALIDYRNNFLANS